jgi:hypothetical protein
MDGSDFEKFFSTLKEDDALTGMRAITDLGEASFKACQFRCPKSHHG